MHLIEKQVFVVLKLSRGRSDVVSVFTKLEHANRFIAKIKRNVPGTYAVDTSTLYDFEP